MNENKNVRPAPIEFLHDEIMKEFHAFRENNSKTTSVMLTGKEMNAFIAKAKQKTYKEYAGVVSNDFIAKIPNGQKLQVAVIGTSSAFKEYVEKHANPIVQYIHVRKESDVRGIQFIDRVQILYGGLTAFEVQRVFKLEELCKTRKRK